MRFHAVERLGERQALTGDGFLVCYDTPIARCGLQVYHPGELPTAEAVGADDLIEVERRPAEVFDTDAMQSFEGKPVVLSHPAGMVTPDTWRDADVVGHIQNVRQGKPPDVRRDIIGRHRAGKPCHQPRADTAVGSLRADLARRIAMSPLSSGRCS
jgi:Uncharacterized protein conserved in bacteria (DUF2213)